MGRIILNSDFGFFFKERFLLIEVFIVTLAAKNILGEKVYVTNHRASAESSH